MRIAIANASICISCGGSEHAAIRLAHALQEKGHEVHLLTVRGTSSPVYPLDPLLPVHFFPDSFWERKYDAMRNGPELIKKYNIEVLVSLESDWKHSLWHVCCEGTQAAFVCSERIHPHFMETAFWNAQDRQLVLKSADAIHELLPCYLPYIPGELRDKAFVIPNARPSGSAEFCPQHSSENPRLLFLGRFTANKRPELLLQAFALLAAEFPQWKLRLAGWGYTRDVLENGIAEYRLEDRVLIGNSEGDVHNEYLNANIYCLPSLYEGFPNTVLEAMCNGLPIVGIKDNLAMTSIIEPGKTGLLAERATPEELAKTLRGLMSSENARLRMGKNAWQKSNDYVETLIFNQWEEQLQRIVDSRGERPRSRMRLRAAGWPSAIAGMPPQESDLGGSDSL